MLGGGADAIPAIGKEVTGLHSATATHRSRTARRFQHPEPGRHQGPGRGAHATSLLAGIATVSLVVGGVGS
jgi:hypothetical protein